MQGRLRGRRRSLPGAAGSVRCRRRSDVRAGAGDRDGFERPHLQGDVAIHILPGLSVSFFLERFESRHIHFQGDTALRQADELEATRRGCTDFGQHATFRIHGDHENARENGVRRGR